MTWEVWGRWQGFMPKRKGALPPDEYVKILEAVYERDGWKCRECGSRKHLVAHHVMRRSKGGPDSLSNLETLCSTCHEKRHQGRLRKTAATFSSWIGRRTP